MNYTQGGIHSFTLTFIPSVSLFLSVF
jgi:hypothetical protein